MTDNEGPLTAKMNLALSRAQLLAAMGYQEVLNASGDDRIEPLRADPAEPAPTQVGPTRLVPPLSRWWRHHPARNAVELARPLLESYGRQHPGRLVGYGAGAGALLVLLKPWRFLSAMTIAGLVVKTLAPLGTKALKTPRA